LGSSIFIVEWCMSAKKDLLKSYRVRRNFSCTPEPKGESVARGSRRFVIQKHAARNLHYDVRIAIDGVLVSWAVPKGPSCDPTGKRLAIMTEDHPLEYARFEGMIPEGEYGAGAVMVWDIGTYRNLKKQNGKTVPMSKCLKDGRIEIFLKGKKLQGGYALIRTGDKNSKQWLLIKIRDEYADARRKPVSSEPNSVLTGRTLYQIKKDSRK
jgi:DNA ligase D-like protein (predicted 3'-phosphoesterase)